MDKGPAMRRPQAKAILTAKLPKGTVLHLHKASMGIPIHLREAMILAGPHIPLSSNSMAMARHRPLAMETQMIAGSFLEASEVASEQALLAMLWGKQSFHLSFYLSAADAPGNS